MSDPLALFPLALAASGGRIDEWPASQLVAAGLTLLQRSAPLVRALAGRRSAILLPTTASYVTALAASDGRGAVLINPLASPVEIAWQLLDANVGAVFTTSTLAARLPVEMPRVLLDQVPRSARIIVGDVERDIDLGSHVGLELSGDATAEGRDEEAVIVYTSAMQGTPLGAILTHRNVLSNARATASAAHDGPDDHSLALLPFAHLFGLVVAGAATLLTGGRVTTMERFTAAAALELIERKDITRLVAVPSVYAALLQLIERRGVQWSAPKLRLCLCGGAPLHAALQERWVAVTGVELRQGYGLTEASPVCLVNRLDQPNRMDNLGSALAGVEVSVRDPLSGASRGIGETGEICVRGPNVFRGYVSGGEAGLQVRDGWLCTGDIGVQHADGSVSFRGVSKAMFTRNGFNIYPRELERAIARMDGVTHVEVRATPDALKEHDIAVNVQGAVNIDDVRRWCAAQLSWYKQPSDIRVVSARAD